MVIYLDNHSTTRLDPRVLEAMLPWLTDDYGNAGSVTHEMGRAARAAVESARELFAASIGATAREIVFTSGATESINLAILGSVSRRGLGGQGQGHGFQQSHRSDQSDRQKMGHLLTVANEHNAVLDTLDHVERLGHAVTQLPVFQQQSLPPGSQRQGVVGQLSLDELSAAFRPDTFLVSVMLANNEIGTIQNIPAIAQRVHAHGALLHVDCAQGLGRMPVSVSAMDADLASFSSHKFHGPKGVGALYVRRSGRAVRIDPLVFGGGQERGMRSGTLDVPGIVGMAAAAQLAVAGLPVEAARMRELRDMLWSLLSQSIDGIFINGPPLNDPMERLVNNLNVRVAGIEGESLLATLSADGLAVSSGSACSSESPRPSHVLLAIGLDSDQARASLRFGLSRFTAADEVVEAAARIAAGVARLRRL
ncbi:MAG: cysteine desulfurase family protein [Planctomycetia bacterium]|nr:cysteine desulfurase family protein [Planctomycetia bacterium]RLT15555.1 MAG: cysteine desulfurase [Planctomycetota bacterium]